ncbi:MAG TPA: hypothetical protein EYM43_02205 [Alphaproteobacteria bacterium]|nr:hypothetical protein [Alphaproteobacteria bacterium]
MSMEVAMNRLSDKLKFAHSWGLVFLMGLEIQVHYGVNLTYVVLLLVISQTRSFLVLQQPIMRTYKLVPTTPEWSNETSVNHRYLFSAETTQ